MRWNLLIPLFALVVAGLIGWEKGTQSPDRGTDPKRIEPNDRTADGQVVRAVQLYRLATTNGDGQAVELRQHDVEEDQIRHGLRRFDHGERLLTPGTAPGSRQA